MARPRHHSSSERSAGGQRGYPRAARLNALLQEVLAEELERIVDSDERLGLVTLTGVACEPDLRHAVVFLASLSDEAGVVLEEHRRELQAAIAAQVRTRRVPTLSFEPDPAIAAAQRVEDALARARQRDALIVLEGVAQGDSPDHEAPPSPAGSAAPGVASAAEVATHSSRPPAGA
jgi:ribosome-binding factor A